MSNLLNESVLKRFLKPLIPGHARATAGKLRSIFLGSRPDPFGTHVPILVGLGKNLHIASVLELGCGYYSTLLFLNRQAFPYLEKLDSYDNDSQWIETISSKTKNDMRVHFFLKEQPMHITVQNIDLSAYDLVFIDDSISYDLRTQTIKVVTSRREQINGIVAIHDYEQECYREACKEFQYQYRFSVFNPEVGILWQRSLNVEMELRTIQKALEFHVHTVVPENVERWIKAFQT